MKTVELKVYEYGELAQKAKDRAYDEWLQDYEYPWSDEAKDTLKAFERVFPIKLKNWSYGGRGEGVQFSMMCRPEVADLKWHRLAKYVWNNYKKELFKGKFYFNTTKKRYSKIIIEDDCVLTGVVFDCEILKDIYSFLKKPDDRNFEELMRDCLLNWVFYCSKDLDYCSSRFYFEQYAEDCDLGFDENGKRVS